MTMQDLRGRAEHAVRMTRRDLSALAQLDVQHLVHELQVHQVELEMQNESLRSSQLDVEQSKERYEELFEYAPASYLMLDGAGLIVQANAAALAMLGVPRRRLLGQPFAAFVSAEDLASFDRHLRELRRETRSVREVRLVQTNGKSTHVRLDTSSIPEVTGCVLILTDISDRVRAREAEQRQRIEREAELVQRIAVLESQKQLLESEIAGRARSETARLSEEGRTREIDRLQSLGMLAAGIAHDFNNLLVGVLGNADILLSTPELPEAWREPLSLIKRAGRNASDLTRQLLVFAGLGRLSMAPVNFGRIVSDVLELVRTTLPPGVRLQARLEPSLPSIMGDRGQVHQVVMNLVTNAIEAVDRQGEITIHMWEQPLDAAALAHYQPHTDAKPGRFVVMQVNDSGPGIDAAKLSRIFDPFFTTKFTGRGLGLATALGIVQSHQGVLGVRSALGQGTTFEVAFPLTDSRRESERPSPAREPEWTGSGSVLVIDDDENVRRVVSQLLELIGFEVTSVGGGDEGLKRFSEDTHRFEFVVLDWLMPGISGEQVLRSLRELEPDVPVILVSGLSIADLPIKDRRVGRVQKPMTLDELRDAVRKVTDPAHAGGVNVPRLRPLTGG